MYGVFEHNLSQVEAVNELSFTWFDSTPVNPFNSLQRPYVRRRSGVTGPIAGSRS
jgi:hypothetical protein